MADDRNAKSKEAPMTKVSENKVANEIVSMVTKCLDKVSQANQEVADQKGDPHKRLFFPAGIELIYVKLHFGKEAGVTFALAGPNAKYPKDTEIDENSVIVADKSGTRFIPTT
jgi:hypothetical protein